jgi:DNA-binding NtrC family response regulator
MTQKLAPQKCVLVIDDETAVREAVADILELQKIEVIAAPDGQSGIDLYQERIDDVSLILLDLSMPGMDGNETFRELRRINPDVCVILSSGYNQVEATQHFTGKGLAAFIQKPYKANDLIEAVKQHIQ